MNTLQRAWRQPAPYAPLGLALAGTLCVLALLLAFQNVVRQGVQQGESRNRAIAAHADGVWRCNALRVIGERAGCRVRLDAAHAAAPVVTTRGDAAMAMTVARVEP
jgi:hypothetical protein